MKKTISLKVNGLERSVEVEPRMTLLDLVREQFGLTGAKLGCDIHPLQDAFMEFGALQCGYCTSGFILSAKALLDECDQPSEQQIRDYLAGNFCRCGCYQEIMQAVKNVARKS